MDDEMQNVFKENKTCTLIPLLEGKQAVGWNVDGYMQLKKVQMERNPEGKICCTKLKPN